MPYYQIQDFKSGLDSRRMRETSPPGALISAKNCHITRGGEVEKRLAWVPYVDLPPETFGLAEITDTLFVFGSAEEPEDLPDAVAYQRLTAATGSAMARVLGNDTFDDRHYVSARFADGTVEHFYDGAPTEFNPTARLRFQIEAVDRDDDGDEADDDADEEADEDADETVLGGEVTSLTVGDTELLAEAVTWADATEDAAAALVAGIEANAAVSGWRASQDGTYVTIFAEVADTADNGKTVTIAYAGADVDANDDTNSPYEISTVEGAAQDVQRRGGVLRVYGDKVYTGIGSILFFSAINDPTKFFETDDAVGAGFINLGNQAQGTLEISGLAEYADQLAVFTRQNIQVWSMTADPGTNVRLQTLPNVGTIAPGSVVAFGDLDVFFVSSSGVRSLKSRDQTNAAFASDVGTAIDTLVAADIRSDYDTVAAAQGILEPIEGRYILGIGEEAYVFSYFPESQISAWSKYTLPGAVDKFVRTPERLYARSGDTVYLLGGEDGTAYDDAPVTLVTPFLDAETPAAMKNLTAVDIACDGTWKIEVAFDPRQPDVFEEIATVTGSTLFDMAIAAYGRSTSFCFRFTSQNEGYARIGSFIFHFTEEEAT